MSLKKSYLWQLFMIKLLQYVEIEYLNEPLYTSSKSYQIDEYYVKHILIK